jgi:NTP pyrophosphatase (non-canonical NTP hydrolase)
MVNERDLYKKAIQKWGAQSQILMTCEECGELLQALSKYNRGQVTEQKVHECIVDAWVMLSQMMILFGLSTQVFEEIKKEKLAHLQSLLEKK